MNATELLFIPSSTPAETVMEAGPRAPRTGISFREAALRLGISEKTLRARIRSGEVDGWTVEGKRGLEWRVHLPEGRDPDRASGSGERDPDRDPVLPDRDIDRSLPVLQARLDGALLAARLHADRRRHVERQVENAQICAVQERGRLHGEIDFLRQQLQQRTDAERELRLLLASTQQAISAITQRPALEPIGSIPRPKWWSLWRRGG